MNSITVSNLHKHFKVFKRQEGLIPTLKSLVRRKHHIVKAVDNISFKISEGELVGFIGPNGAGKTTTLKCLSGLLYPSQGKITVSEFTPFERKQQFLKSISLVMGQKNQLWWDLPAIETFRLNKEIYEIDDYSYKKNLDELIELLEISQLINIPVRNLSLGERMKMELAAALIYKPRILFLDEPTIGLDIVMQKRMRQFIKNYNKKYGSTVILTSHYMNDVEKLCERVIIINHGRIIYDGKLKQLVSKFTNYKLLSVIFEKRPDLTNLISEQFIRYIGRQSAVLTVPKTEINQITGKLLSKYKILDINIEDPELEDIISSVFAEKE